MSAFQTFGSNQPSISSANVLFLGNQFNILILLASWQMFAVPELVIATRAHMNLPRNYYEVLDVPRSADQKQIKKAFHKLALKYHPDKNKEPGAEERFREITQAYDTLSNKAKRKQYDQFGGEHGQPQKQQTFQQGNVKDLFDSFNFDDMFNKFHEKYDKSHHQSNDHFSFGFSNFFDNANLRQQKAASDEQNELFGKFPFLMIKNMFNIAADFVNGRREQKKKNCRRVTKQIQDTIISNIVCD